MPPLQKLACVVAFTVFSSSCASIPVTGMTVANGQPLEPRSESGTYHEKVYSGGSSYATGRTQDYYVFKGYFQGDTQIDEQDFFTIAGDTESADKVAAIRKRAFAIQIASIIGTFVGAGVGGVGTYLAVTNPTPDGGEMPELQSVGLTLGAVGFAVAIALGALWGISYSALQPMHALLLDGDVPRKGEEASVAYNTAHGFRTEWLPLTPRPSFALMADAPVRTALTPNVMPRLRRE